MFLIFEGTDLAGKSTIIKSLIEKQSRFKPFNFFNSKKTNDWMKYIDVIAETEYNVLKQIQNNNFILDRFFVSSIIYEKVFNRKYDISYINENDFSDSITVFVKTPLDVLIDRSKYRNEDSKILNRLEVLLYEYENYFSTYKNKLIVIDGSLDIEDNINILLSEIIKYE
jgi:thymidylate kinase